MKKIGLIILNWNGYEDTIACITSIFNADIADMEVLIYILDNNSQNESVQNISHYLSDSGIDWCLLSDQNPVSGDKASVYFYVSQNNIGFCSGNNQGMSFAFANGCDFVMLLNNDTEIDKEFFKEFSRWQAEIDTKNFICAPAITYYNAPELLWYGGGNINRFLETNRHLDGSRVDKLPREPYETEWISGCATIIPLEVYNKIGGYDEIFFIWSEEWDYSIRAKKNGIRRIIIPSAIVKHKVGHSLGVMKRLAYYYATRNRLLLQYKHLSLFDRILFNLWFFPTRAIKYSYFLINKRYDLIDAGVSAIYDYHTGMTGKWRKHDRK